MGVRLGLEAVNRYESNVINTLDAAATIVRAVGTRTLFVHADVFHMNIEEAEISTAVRDAGDVIGYVHVAESNRGPLGTGNIPWGLLFDALRSISYTGPLTFESFSPGGSRCRTDRHARPVAFAVAGPGPSGSRRLDIHARRARGLMPRRLPGEVRDL